MTNIGPRKKEIVLKLQKQQEKIWLFLVETKFIGKQDGKIALMVLPLLFVPWFVTKRELYRRSRKKHVAQNVMFQQMNGRACGGMVVTIPVLRMPANLKMHYPARSAGMEYRAQ